MISFETSEKLLTHVLNHVLTPEEAHAWYYVWEELDERLAPTPAGAEFCFDLRRQLPTDAQLQQSLTNRYLDTIAHQVQESVQMAWTAESRWQQVGLGLAGVYYVLVRHKDRAETIVTAYIPGFGSAAGTTQSQAEPDNPHARARGVSWMRGERDEGQRKDTDRSIAMRLRERRAQDWNASQRLYYLVFRPAIQFVRGWQDWKRPHRLNMSSLGASLPSMSHLKYEDWLNLRTRHAGHLHE